MVCVGGGALKREGGVYTYVSEGGVRDQRMRIKGVGLAHNYEFKFKRVRAATVLDLFPPFLEPQTNGLARNTANTRGMLTLDRAQHK